MFPSAGYAPERGHTDHSTVVNNTLYENDTAETGSGEFQMQWNMADDVFENNIVYAGPRCLITLSKAQIDKNHPAVTIDHNVYYCASGPQTSTWKNAFGDHNWIRQICSGYGERPPFQLCRPPFRRSSRERLPFEIRFSGDRCRQPCRSATRRTGSGRLTPRRVWKDRCRLLPEKVGGCATVLKLLDRCKSSLR